MNIISLRVFIFLCIINCFFTACNKEKEYDASGVFEATEVIISAESNGVIQHLQLEEGQNVEYAQILGNIDATSLSLKKKQMQSNVNAIRALSPDIGTQIAVIKQQIEKWQEEKARVQRLLAANAANQKQLDDINSQLEILQKQLVAKQTILQQNSKGISAQTQAAKAQLEQVEDLLEKSIIRSKINGTILAKYAEQGELAHTGMPLFKIANLEKMYLRAYLKNTQLTQVQLGQKVEVETDFGEDENRTYDGVITWISNEAEFTPKTVQNRSERNNLVYAIKIAVVNDGYLKIGMYGQAFFTTENHE